MKNKPSTRLISYKGIDCYIGPWEAPKGIKLSKDTGLFKFVYDDEIIYIGTSTWKPLSTCIDEKLRDTSFSPYIDKVEIFWIPFSVEIREKFELELKVYLEPAKKYLIHKYKPILNEIPEVASQTNKDIEEVLPDWIPYKDFIVEPSTIYQFRTVPNGSSFGEAAVYYYVHKYFPKALYRSTSVIGSELDVYIPYKKVAIEYDGSFYHKRLKNQFKEFEKNSKCKDKGITLIRIIDGKRETAWYEKDENGVLYDDPGYIPLFRKSQNPRGLDECIKTLICELLNVKQDIDVDTEKEREKIEKLVWYASSFEYKCPEYLKYWDYERNGNIIPSEILFNSHNRVWFKCDSGCLFYMSPYSLIHFGLSYRKSNYCEKCSCKCEPLVTSKELLGREYPKFYEKRK